jgi:hypothetical protein
MRYQSPVDLIVSEMNMKLDGTIFKAVQNVGVNVDRDELIKALQYDRQQYQKGYADRDAEIVRCKDCKWWHKSETHNGYGDCGQANGITLKSSDWFCADGEKSS